VSQHIIHILKPSDRLVQSLPPHLVINATSRSHDEWSKGLSPFFLGPVELYGNFVSKNFENGWQFAKVYPEFATEKGEPSEKYFEWALNGWNTAKAIRFPMGRDKKPLYSLWEGKKLGYIEARKAIYAPIYAKYVTQTIAFGKVKKIFDKNNEIYLLDFDGYDYVAQHKTLSQVINDPNKKMGHAFVLAMLLLNEHVWETEKVQVETDHVVNGKEEIE